MTINVEDLFPFIESRAFTRLLEGMKVTASTYPQGRVVPVTWVRPDMELQKAAYPGIYISYADVSKAEDREVRGPTNLTYAPPGLPTSVQVPADMDDKNSTVTVDWGVDGFDRLSSPYHLPEHPLPYNLDFNVAVLTRNYDENFQLIAQLMQIGRLPERFGGLEVPEDGTVRTLELLGGPDTDVVEDEDGKRLVQTLYSVRVAAELSLYDVEQVKRVEEINIAPVTDPPGFYL